MMTFILGLVVLAPLAYWGRKALLNAPPVFFDWPSITLPPFNDREHQQ